MKILYYRRKATNNMGHWQDIHFIDELSRLGILFELFDPFDFCSPEEANIELQRFVDKNSFDLFMTPYNEDLIFEDTIDKIRTKGIPNLLICFDNLVIPYQHKQIASKFDLVWLTSIETESLFHKWGANTIFQPYAANPYRFYPVPRQKRNRAVFLGTPYGARVDMLNNLIRANVPIDLFCPKKRDQHVLSGFQFPDHTINNLVQMLGFDIGRKQIKSAFLKRFVKKERLLYDSTCVKKFDAVPVEAIPEIYSVYSLAISSTTAKNTGLLKDPVPIINLRSFEIPMCGGLQICRWNSELASYFEEDREIVFWKNDEEFIEKAKFWLSPERAEKVETMKCAARQRAKEEHTWTIRFEQIFRKIGIKVLA